MGYFDEKCEWCGGYAPRTPGNTAIPNTSYWFCSKKCQMEYDAAKRANAGPDYFAIAKQYGDNGQHDLAIQNYTEIIRHLGRLCALELF